MPIVKKDADREPVMAAAYGMAAALKAAGMRAKVDAGTEKTPGWKFNFWEMKVTTRFTETNPSCSCTVYMEPYPRT